ncbi:MAG: EAL domain-containing protein [Altererythrobacter sp.]|nr:EAL domain-containing protein [Altererythrobacter sp.]MBO6709530.1 EAL domain-containing protein [Altererythrobacter sp.]
MVLEQRSLASLLVFAGSAMVALTGVAQAVLFSSTDAFADGIWTQLIVMCGTSSCATIFVLGLLHNDLDKYYAQILERQEEAQLEARRDELTGFGNRKALIECLSDARSDLPTAEPVSYLGIMDLDHFKNINDTLGHEAGDALLQQVAERIQAVAKSKAKVYRLGGDEFAVTFLSCKLKEVLRICSEIRSRILDEFLIGQTQALVGCSIGIAKTDKRYQESEWLRRADMAMYKAKNGGVGIAFFDKSMELEAKRKTELSLRLTRAFEEKENLSAKYQAIFSTDKRIVAVEALFRWFDPDFGMIATDEAIKIARQNRLLDQISLFVAEKAAATVSEAADLALCVNVEAIQLLDENFTRQLYACLLENGLDPIRVQLEIGEADFVEYADQLVSPLSRLVEQGFTIAVDNFGSSNASLTHLKKIGVKAVKFDPSILQHARESDNPTVLKAKTNLAKSLDMVVTCKGISDKVDEDLAMSAGCECLQGFYYGRPDAISSFTTHIETINSMAAA